MEFNNGKGGEGKKPSLGQIFMRGMPGRLPFAQKSDEPHRSRTENKQLHFSTTTACSDITMKWRNCLLFQES